MADWSSREADSIIDLIKRHPDAARNIIAAKLRCYRAVGEKDGIEASARAINAVFDAPQPVTLVADVCRGVARRQ